VSVEYKYRRYEPGDAEAINRLYFKITGTSRSRQQFEWQWLNAPGGPGDIWLIEAVSGSGDAELVGHHGIMPIPFCRGNDELLFGKTENTMLLPEYRSRILYPRFEKRFAEKYEVRFDALFSTFGHAAAIRQRRAMRYEFPTRWLSFRMPTRWFGNVLFACGILLNRVRRVDSAPQPSGPAPSLEVSESTSSSPLVLRALDASQAAGDPFFDSFWPACRSQYGLTPRREKEDLDWRFWKNPYWSYTTLVSDNHAGELGYVVLRLGGSTSDTAIIEDIVPGVPTARHFCRLLDSALSWLSSHGVRWAEFTTTDENCGKDSMAADLRNRQIIPLRQIERFRPTPERLMPRKITESGRSKGVDMHDWYVTPLIFEGR
jgi:hypothetical protein